MDLSQLTNQPERTVEIGGKPYQFGELPIDALGRLQAWIKAHVPHPLDAVKGHLDGLSEADRRYLLEQARQEARQWPPVIGTAAGAAALLSTEAGQLAAFAEGLRVHQPAATDKDAAALFKRLRTDAAKAAAAAAKAGRQYDGEGPARDIFAVLFGLDPRDHDDDDGDGENLPKS